MVRWTAFVRRESSAHPFLGASWRVVQTRPGLVGAGRCLETAASGTARARVSA